MTNTDPFNRSPIYNKDHDKRVISTPNGTWTPQKRVSHTPGCNKKHCWIQVDKEHGYHKFDADAPHFDPWQNTGPACESKMDAIMCIFGPKYHDQIV